MIKVLFLCLGNICRSPMAEAIFKEMVRQQGLEDRIQVSSAGTGDWHLNERPHVKTQEILKKYNIDFTGIISRQVTEKDLQECQYIIAMDDKNVADLAAFGEAHSETYVGRLSDFVTDSHWDNVPDPYFTGDFDETYDLVKSGCGCLLSFIKEKHVL